MSEDEGELRSVIAAVTQLVRDEGQTMSARIGELLRQKHPDFEVRPRFRNLTDMLDRAAPMLSIIGRSGTDYIWSTDADLDQLDTDLEVDDNDATNSVDMAAAPLLRGFSSHGFKSLTDVTVTLRPFNILVGANGAGKTSILEGLFMLSQLRYKKPATIFSGSRELSQIISAGKGAMRLRITDERDQYVEYEGRLRADEPSEHLLRIGEGGQEYEHSYNQTAIAVRSLRLLPLLQSFGGTTLLHLDAHRLAKPSVSSNEQPTLRHDGRGLSSVLANLAATDPGRLDLIFAATKAIIPAFGGARMPRQRVGVAMRDGTQREIGHGLLLQLHDQWLDAGLASEGTLLVLGLMTVVHGLNTTRLLLMDDIDRALHPKAQRSLVQHLKDITKNNRGLQLVCTTHSPYMLDAVDPQDIIVVRVSPETGETRARHLVEHDAWDTWSDSMTPGEFWTYVGEDWLELE